MAVTAHLLDTLPPESRDRLTELAKETEFPAGTRIFEEGRRADRFWIIRRGNVRLDMRVPGRQPVTVESLQSGDLVGWSWLFPPYTWHLAARAVNDVQVLEFDADVVRELCETDPEFGRAVVLHVAEVIGSRLRAARRHILELYGPYGTGRPGGSDADDEGDDDANPN
ncbi:hypothetical protein SRB5_52440 [Streptomyces sp. RB5]|uniref:Cyclic nucleotide-binding domain-containing protein n=1 Tax=Streptomyces smaragdinus TaxID=2585196 RepID=A0A7K0CNJ6_9ACTN|nr:cyclic nucleotide-binding domain-containing protein [Streptomyces smaragdinus]MQY15066.1 hypothetical protein [Streptomyces smaragdinus]